MEKRNVPKGFAGLSDLVDRKEVAEQESPKRQATPPAEPPVVSRQAEPQQSGAPLPTTGGERKKAPSQVAPESLHDGSSPLKWVGVFVFLMGAVIIGGLLSSKPTDSAPSGNSVIEAADALAQAQTAADATDAATAAQAAQEAADIAAAAADAAVSASEIGSASLELADPDAAALAAADAAAAAADAASAEPYTPPATSAAALGGGDEQRPEVGSGRVLYGPQIRYCVRENIRLDAANEVVDSADEGQVDRFNAMIDDYNSRCSSYKYPQGLLQRVESETEALRSTLEAEGRSRFL